MKIYLAGPCSSDHRTFMVSISTFLREAGYEVYCPFELKIENAWDYSQEEWSQLVFEADKKAIDEADIFLMISLGRASTAGTNWEQGYAYATNKYVVVIQFTNETTSLMTYCGCDTFINTDKNHIYADMLCALSAPPTKTKCTTTLT